MSTEATKNKSKSNNHILISAMKSHGYTVRVCHYRNFAIDNTIISLPKCCISFLGDRLLPKGGRTEVSIFDHVNNKYLKGVADCSKNDVFNKKEGLKIALARAIPLGYEKVMLS